MLAHKAHTQVVDDSWTSPPKKHSSQKNTTLQTRNGLIGPHDRQDSALLSANLPDALSEPYKTSGTSVQRGSSGGVPGRVDDTQQERGPTNGPRLAPGARPAEPSGPTTGAAAPAERKTPSRSAAVHIHEQDNSRGHLGGAYASNAAAGASAVHPVDPAVQHPVTLRIKGQEREFPPDFLKLHPQYRALAVLHPLGLTADDWKPVASSVTNAQVVGAKKCLTKVFSFFAKT